MNDKHERNGTTPYDAARSAGDTFSELCGLLMFMGQPDAAEEAAARAALAYLLAASVLPSSRQPRHE